MSAAEPEYEYLRRVGETLGVRLERRVSDDGEPYIAVTQIVPGGLMDDAYTTLAVDGYCAIKIRGIE